MSFWLIGTDHLKEKTVQGVNFGGVADKKFAPQPNEGNRCAYERCSLGYALNPERGEAVRFADVGIPNQWCHKVCAERWESEVRADRIAAASKAQASLQHVDPCTCTRDPQGNVMDYNCGALLKIEGVPQEVVVGEFVTPVDRDLDKEHGVVVADPWPVGREIPEPKSEAQIPQPEATPIVDPVRADHALEKAIRSHVNELQLGEQAYSQGVPPAGELTPPDVVYVAPHEPNPTPQQQTITWTTELVGIFANHGVSFHAGVLSDLIDWKRREL